jgi:L-aspartate oxidase
MLYSLKSLMWRGVGLQRTRSGLQEALHRIGFWSHYLMRSGLRDTRACELANMLTVSALVTRAALERTESRGTHFRTDHPTRDDAAWCRRLVMAMGSDGAIELTHQPLLTPTDFAVKHSD